MIVIIIKNSLVAPKSNSQLWSVTVPLFWVKEWNSWTYRFKQKRRSADCVFFQRFPVTTRLKNIAAHLPLAAENRAEEPHFRTPAPPHWAHLTPCRSARISVDFLSALHELNSIIERMPLHWEIRVHFRLATRGRGLSDAGGGCAWHQPIAASLAASIRAYAV